MNKIGTCIILILLCIVIGERYFHTEIKRFLYKRTVQSSASHIFQQCSKETRREPCYIQQFDKLSQKATLQESKDILLALQQKDPQSRKCHYIAHTIGFNEVMKHPDNWKDLLKGEDPHFCAEGFLHGVLEKYLDSKGKQTSASELAILCKEIDQGTRGEYSCAHIMGHLILVDEAGIVPEGLHTCDELTPNNDLDYKEECYTGIFMELTDKENLVDHGIEATLPVWNEAFAHTIENVCNSYDGLAQRTCWKIISRVYTSIYKADPEKIYAACNQAPTSDDKRYCYIRAVGMIPQSPYFTKNSFEGICSVYKTQKEIVDCNSYLITFALRLSPTYKDSLTAYCNAQRSDETRSACLAQLTRTVGKN